MDKVWQKVVVGGLALIILAAVSAPVRTAAVPAAAVVVAPAPAVVESVSWTADNYITWRVQSPEAAVWIYAIDYRERRQTVGPVPTRRTLTLRLDGNGVPSPQLALLVWRVPGHAQGSLSVALVRPVGTPLTALRSVGVPRRQLVPQSG